MTRYSRIGKTWGPFMVNPSTGVLMVEEDLGDVLSVAVDVAKGQSHDVQVAAPAAGYRIIVVGFNIQSDDVTDDQIGRITLQSHQTAKLHIITDTEGSGVARDRDGGIFACAEAETLTVTTDANTTAVGGISYKVRPV